MLLFTRIHRVYDEIGGLLEPGQTPPPPERTPALAVVPVRGLSRLTREAVSAALSLADEVVAVTICISRRTRNQVTSPPRPRPSGICTGLRGKIVAGATTPPT